MNKSPWKKKESWKILGDLFNLWVCNIKNKKNSVMVDVICNLKEWKWECGRITIKQYGQQRTSMSARNNVYNPFYICTMMHFRMKWTWLDQLKWSQYGRWLKNEKGWWRQLKVTWKQGWKHVFFGIMHTRDAQQSQTGKFLLVNCFFLSVNIFTCLNSYLALKTNFCWLW